MTPSRLSQYHPRHHRLQGFLPSDPTGGQWHVPREKQPQAEYEQLFGYPADIDAVWAAREEYQNAQASDRA